MIANISVKKMVNWQVTAKTIYCETVQDEVTILVYKDGTAKCTGFKRYGESKARGMQAKCNADCSLVTEYKNRLFAEEDANRAS